MSRKNVLRSSDAHVQEDDDDEEDQRLLRPKRPTTATASLPAFVTSSTPQRAGSKAKDRFTSAIPVEDEKELLDGMLANKDEDDDDDERDSQEGLNASDAAPESGEDDEARASGVRHRQHVNQSN